MRPLYYELLIVHIYNQKSVIYCYTLYTLVRKCPVAVSDTKTNTFGLTTIHYRIAGETIPQLAVVPQQRLGEVTTLQYTVLTSSMTDQRVEISHIVYCQCRLACIMYQVM